MIGISLSDKNHKFEKSNLFTQSGKGGSFDEYKCVHCGLKGKRYGLSDIITVKKAKTCTNVAAPKQDSLGQVKISSSIDPRAWGLNPGEIVDRVACPPEEANRFGNDVWVFSPSRKEPVRLFDSEYDEV